VGNLRAWGIWRVVGFGIAAALFAGPVPAHAMGGSVVDTIADIAAVIVLIVVPAGAIYLFWKVHVLPEVIAEKRHHPQKEAIKTLCILSLFFGGLLWPLAWLWAYSKPTLYKLAYGTDSMTTSTRNCRLVRDRRSSRFRACVPISSDSRILA